MPDAGGQGELEFRQPLITEAAAEPDDGRLADRGAVGDFGDGGVDKPLGFCQGAFGNFAFRTGQVGQ